MKKYIHSTTNKFDPNDIYIKRIISLVLTGDLDSCNPRDYAIYGSTDLDYSTMTRDQLIQLPSRDLSRIHDINILRKLNKTDLTIQQQREVAQYNKINFKSNSSQVRNVIQKLQNCPAVSVMRTTKNNDFSQMIWNMGARLRDDDAVDIVHQLHVKDYSYSTYSYLDINWNALLMVFEYTGSHIFAPRKRGNAPVEVDSLDIYIKIDVDNETEDGYAAMSFHNPEFELSHPYKNFPIDKE